MNYSTNALKGIYGGGLDKITGGKIIKFYANTEKISLAVGDSAKHRIQSLNLEWNALLQLLWDKQVALKKEEDAAFFCNSVLDLLGLVRPDAAAADAKPTLAAADAKPTPVDITSKTLDTLRSNVTVNFGFSLDPLRTIAKAFYSFWKVTKDSTESNKISHLAEYVQQMKARLGKSLKCKPTLTPIFESISGKGYNRDVYVTISIEKLEPWRRNIIYIRDIMEELIEKVNKEKDKIIKCEKRMVRICEFLAKLILKMQ